MNLVQQLQESFSSFLIQTFGINKKLVYPCTPTLNIDEAKQEFGDLNSSAALILAKHLKRNPREVAQEIVANFSNEYVEKIEIAGPGFLNLFLTQAAFNTLAQEAFKQKEQFFKPSEISTKKYSIEFVSANPTGPLHFGHGRGGIIGDVLGNILTFLGHAVTKEYYINDVGGQIQKLGQSFKVRCQQIAGMDATIPEGGYFGEYLVDLAKELTAEHGKKLLDQPDTFFQEYAKNKLLERIKSTLHTYGIYYDAWLSEKSLHESGEVEDVLAYLEQRGYLYKKEGALWFKSTAFGDDKDRVVRRASGQLTYMAADIALLKNKIDRGFNHLIMILGHDHHSYAVRLQGTFKALALDEYPLDIILYQLVKLKKDGQEVRMSKRTGEIIDLAEVIATVGTDVARFFYLNRKADAQLEFDLDLAMKKTEENPVYYIQYAYVRTGSILQKSEEVTELRTIKPEDAQHLGPEEHYLLKKITALQELLQNIGTNHQTHLLAYYSHELAQLFSRYYSKHRVINTANITRSRARLALTTILRDTLALCLQLMGISQPERM